MMVLACKEKTTIESWFKGIKCFSLFVTVQVLCSFAISNKHHEMDFLFTGVTCTTGITHVAMPVLTEMDGISVQHHQQEMSDRHN